MPQSARDAGVLQGLKYYLGGIYRQASDKPIFLYAQAIAFKVLITVVPLVFLSVAILGNVLRRENPFETVSAYIREFLPGYRSQELIDALNSLQQASSTLTIIGIAGTVIFVMTLFTTRRVVISSVFQEEWHDQRSILGGYAFDLRMAAQVGLLFLLTLALTSSLRFLETEPLELLARLNLDFVWLLEGWKSTIQIALYLVPFLLSVAMFFLLLYFIPLPHPPKRSAALGAITTALLWELAKNAFTIYATRAGRFDFATPTTGGGGETAVGFLGNTFGLILAFVFWVYYSGVVLCIGAIVALLNEKQYRLRKKRLQAEAVQATTALDEAEERKETPVAPVEAEGGQVG